MLYYPTLPLPQENVTQENLLAEFKTKELTMMDVEKLSSESLIAMGKFYHLSDNISNSVEFKAKLIKSSEAKIWGGCGNRTHAG